MEFLLSNGAELEERDNDGLTPLGLAAKHRSLSSFAFLLEKGSDINTRDGKGMTPLMHTVTPLPLTGYRIINNFYIETPVRWDNDWEEGGFETMKYILKQKNVDINCKSEDGETALSLAVKRRYRKSERVLREHGAVDIS